MSFAAVHAHVLLFEPIEFLAQVSAPPKKSVRNVIPKQHPYKRKKSQIVSHVREWIISCRDEMEEDERVRVLSKR